MTLEETNAQKAEIMAALTADDTADAEKQTAPPKPRGRKRKNPIPTIEPPTDAGADEPTPIKINDGVILRCECGADILPDKRGLYPRTCPQCGTVNDYRNVAFLVNNPNVLVCDKCGGLTPVIPNTPPKCEHCGYDGR